MWWMCVDYTRMARDDDESDVDGDTSTEEVVLHHDWERDNSVSATIIEGVAAVTDTPIMDLDPPLREIVDPDALNNLCQPLNNDVLRDGSGQLTLPLHGCIVTLDWSGRIKIEPPDES